MNNSLRAWSLLALLSLSMLALGHSLAGREGLLWALVLSLSVNCLVYLYADQKILGQFPGQLLEGRDPWGILQHTHHLTKKAKLPFPNIIVTDSNSPQALTIARNWHSSYIILTRGLLDKLDKQEISAVLAYCLASIKRQDTLIYLVASAFCGSLLLVSKMLDSLLRGLIGTKKDSTAFYSHPFTYLISPLCRLILLGALDSSTYYHTDELAAKLIDDPKLMATTLWKLNSYRSTLPFDAPASYAHGFIVNPLTGKGWTRYFQAQPTAEKRIHRLIGYYPI